MAKISPVSIKYMIRATFEAIGPIEKPDVIGALFGQTEGLLGDELELRELQKEGKIGRIEVEAESSSGRTRGKIYIPTALDKSETSLIAAAIETIDRVGPTEAKITIEAIEDVRGNKRDYIIERAKKLLENMGSSQSSKEISNIVKIGSRTAKIQEYGDEKLPAGDIDGKEIIVVEGRADVINLLENRINNVIGMNGTKLPKTISELGKTKEITLFLDGDRGGKLIAQNVLENAKVKYIAFAPDGKEVEELRGKEILASLRKKMTPEEFNSSVRNHNINNNFNDNSNNNNNNNNLNKKEQTEEFDETKIDLLINEAKNSKKTYLIDKKGGVIKKVPNTKAVNEIKRHENIYAVIIDGNATKSIIESVKEKGVKIIAAKNFSNEIPELKTISF
jgi:DNA primase